MERINNTLMQYVNSEKVLGYARPLALALFIMLIGWQSARLVLLLLPKQADHGKWVAPPTDIAASAVGKQADVQRIKRANLFGEAPKVAAEPQMSVTNAPVTRLKLTLAGVVASSNPATAMAIIASSGKQATYGIDDKIDGTRAVLKLVEADRVVIDNRGILETLMLDGERATTTRIPRNTPAAPQRQTKTQHQKKDVSEILASAGMRRNASEQELIAKLTDFIRISPKREGNKLVGFRINPGQDRKLFNAIGLKPNDLAVALNGTDLTDMIQATQAIRELPQQSEVMITVLRGEELHEFLLELPSE